MKSKNAVSKSYLSDSQRFSQVCNNELFGGKDFIKTDFLQELDPESILVKGLKPEE